MQPPRLKLEVQLASAARNLRHLLARKVGFRRSGNGNGQLDGSVPLLTFDLNKSELEPPELLGAQNHQMRARRPHSNEALALRQAPAMRTAYHRDELLAERLRRAHPLGIREVSPMG